jgi:CHAD domain-containing protein
VERFEELRSDALKRWNHGKRIHKLRTQARRLRAAVEDLCDCTPCAPQLLETCRELNDETTAARDSLVMIERLQRYRRFAMPAERAEIENLCDDLRKEHRKGLKRAKAATKSCRMEMQS